MGRSVCVYLQTQRGALLNFCWPKTGRPGPFDLIFVGSHQNQNPNQKTTELWVSANIARGRWQLQLRGRRAVRPRPGRPPTQTRTRTTVRWPTGLLRSGCGVESARSRWWPHFRVRMALVDGRWLMADGGTGGTLWTLEFRGPFGGPLYGLFPKALLYKELPL
jgi:hypothetical protein